MLAQFLLWNFPMLAGLAGFLSGVLLASAGLVILLKRKDRESEELIREKVEKALAAENRVQQAQRMEALAKLAGGAAHTFNNYLTSILGFSELLLETASADNPARDGIEAIRKSAQRGSEFTSQLFALGGRQGLQLEMLDLKSCIENALPDLRILAGAGIELNVNLDIRIGRVRADKTQIGTVLKNLITSMRDVLPDKSRIAMDACNVEFAETFFKDFCELKPGRYVQLSLRDDGKGLDEETRRRIFEPYFLPKQKSKGGGLAPALTYSLVRQFGGNIAVSSEKGKGTAFSVYFSSE